MSVSEVFLEQPEVSILVNDVNGIIPFFGSDPEMDRGSISVYLVVGELVTSFVECGLERCCLPLNFVLLEVKIDHLYR
jgi:hypothetical protein